MERQASQMVEQETAPVTDQETDQARAEAADRGMGQARVQEADRESAAEGSGSNVVIGQQCGDWNAGPGAKEKTPDFPCKLVAWKGQ